MHGANFPPEHPELAGVRLTYPFAVDLVASLHVAAGASFRQAFLFENLLLGPRSPSCSAGSALPLTATAGPRS